MNAFRDLKVAIAFVFIIVIAGGASAWLSGHALSAAPLSPVGSQTAAVAEINHVAHALSDAPLSLITEPEGGVSEIEHAIQSAKTSADFVIYQLTDPSVIQDLIDAEARGVNVRVILNSKSIFGKNANTETYATLEAAHVPVEWSSSRFTFTHQKTLVVDNAEAIIMTFNLTPKYYASSRDFAVLNENPRDISAIEHSFDADWNDSATTANVGDDLVWSPGAAPTLLALITEAKTSVDVYNEEMADPRIIEALEEAATRGVSVRVVMTYATSWKGAFNELIEKGITVRTFSSSAKLYIHAKMIAIDGKTAFLGSENFSGTSLDDNRELGILIGNPDILSSLESTFENDFAAARPYALRN